MVAQQGRTSRHTDSARRTNVRNRPGTTLEFRPVELVDTGSRGFVHPSIPVGSTFLHATVNGELCAFECFIQLKRGARAVTVICGCPKWGLLQCSISQGRDGGDA
eukprot:5519309-Prymnesium_polylepis.2